MPLGALQQAVQPTRPGPLPGRKQLKMPAVVCGDTLLPGQHHAPFSRVSPVEPPCIVWTPVTPRVTIRSASRHCHVSARDRFPHTALPSAELPCQGKHQTEQEQRRAAGCSAGPPACPLCCLHHTALRVCLPVFFCWDYLSLSPPAQAWSSRRKQWEHSTWRTLWPKSCPARPPGSRGGSEGLRHGAS